ncbi:MAG TPA: Ig-like domain-containing protein [Candidatus Sulfotelmatobacter sp.]|nr:Ig-like domain-containing protein [Candidatus Sulfotelmatobacter sp.]
MVAAAEGPDAELEELFGADPELLEIAQLARASRPTPVLDARFQRQLRVRLMNEAQKRRVASDRRPWWRPQRRVAWGMSALAACMAAVAALVVAGSHSHDHVTFVSWQSAVTEQHAVTADVITVSFNQPMDEKSVVSGLRLQPATAVTTSWKDNTLVITPLHHLAANTPYTVSIGRTAARAVTGSAPPSDIHIPFGTAPAPARATIPPSPPPSPLELDRLGDALPGGNVLFTADGAPVATRAILPSAPTAAPTPTSPPSLLSPFRGLLSLTPISPTPVPTPAPPAGSAGPAAAVVYSGTGTRTVGPGASAAAFSPSGRNLAAVVPRPGGGGDLTVSGADGASTVLATLSSEASEVAWASESTVVYADGSQIRSVGLDRTIGTVVTLPAGSSVIHLAPGGEHAVISGSAAGAAPPALYLLDLANQLSRPLPGAASLSTFSADGHSIAWFNGAALQVAPVDTLSAVAVPVPGGSKPVALALSNDRSKLAYSLANRSPGTGSTSLVSVPAGKVFATGPEAQVLAFAPAGDHLALLLPAVGGRQTIDEAGLPGATTSASQPPIPPEADQVLSRFLAAQVARDASAVQTLAPELGNLQALIAPWTTRSHLIDEIAGAGGAVTAHARVIGDPTTARPTAVAADETISLVRGVDGYLVRSVDVGPPHDLPAGPHVVHIASNPTGRVVEVTFDSDLTSSTVPQSLSVRTQDGRVLPATVIYDPDSRTASLNLTTTPPAGSVLTVATSLTDIAGQTLANPLTEALRLG